MVYNKRWRAFYLFIASLIRVAFKRQGKKHRSSYTILYIQGVRKMKGILAITVFIVLAATVSPVITTVSISAHAMDGTGVVDTLTFETVLESSRRWWDFYGVREPFVMKEDGVYKMWFTGYGPNTYRKLQIVYAESLDGVTWINRQMVHYMPGWLRTATRPYVIKEGNTYVMYHTDYFVIRLGNWEHYISKITSDDGIHWGNEQMVLTGTSVQSDQDGANVAVSTVIKEDAQYTMWYSGWTGTNPCSIERATSTDGKTWTNRQRVMDPSPAGWDSGGLVPGDVVRQSDGAYTMYFWVESVTPSIGRAKSIDGITWIDREQILTPDDLGVSNIGFYDIDYFKDTDGKEYLYFSFHEGPRTLPKIGRVQLNPRMIEASMDIDPDTLNLKSKGKWITCYIEFSDGYDVSELDVGAVELETISAEESPTQVGDYDGDGISDLMVKFDRQVLIEYLGGATGDVILTVTGELTDGTPFEGSDTIRVISPGGKGKGAPAIPLGYGLGPNYPNPFNPNTWFPYQLAKDVAVTIRIYNTKGQLIRTLHLGDQEAGIYMTKNRAAYWNGRDATGESVSSGVYLYQLQAGDFSAMRRMVIIK